MIDQESAPDGASTALPYVDAATIVEEGRDGAILLRSAHRARNAPRSIAHLFMAQAQRHPARDMVMQRDGDGRWSGMTYADARARAQAVAQWLLDRGTAIGGGVMILSGNSVEHAAVMLGCYLSGTPSVALSQAYSSSGADFTKLRHCLATIRPGVIFVQSAHAFAEAIAMVREIDPRIAIVSGGGGADTIALGHVLATVPTAGVDAALDRVGADVVAKYLFTSGSTGMPKAVPQTHRMMAAMVAARDGLMRDPDERSPRIAVDWMPWSHLSAGNIGFNHNIWAGGTLYLDDGRPTPAGFAATLRNLRELRPPTFASAPIAFEMLADALERDAGAAADILPTLRWMAYGGAALSQEVADRLQAVALRTIGRTIPIITTYGATEVQGITTVHWSTTAVGLIGVPLPGVTLKLAPVGDKLEVRVKGDCVMAGYLDAPQKNAEAFDDEGFYRLGDAVRFVDPADPARGLAFDGRISEDFKLSTGTWVSVGALRPAVVAAASPLLSDAVITGQDRPFVGMLAWLSPSGAADPVAARTAVAERLTAFNAAQGGSSRRIARALIVAEPPSVAAGEITEKGYINQRAVLARRSDDVARLYAELPDAGVIALDR